MSGDALAGTVPVQKTSAMVPARLSFACGELRCGSLCSSASLGTKTGGAEGIRTPDPHNAIVVLYQLSYDPNRFEEFNGRDLFVKAFAAGKRISSQHDLCIDVVQGEVPTAYA